MRCLLTWAKSIGPHIVIAVIDSSPREVIDDKAREAMLEQIKARARGLGADAVQKVRLLSEKGTGFIPDAATPFPAFKQGPLQNEIHARRGSQIPGLGNSASNKIEVIRG